jgi:hypothetical protein
MSRDTVGLVRSFFLAIFWAVVRTGQCIVPCEGINNNDPSMNGTWSSVADWPVLPMHMVLLKTGKVLTYGNNADRKNKAIFYDVWDPSVGLFDPTSHHTLDARTPARLFCNAQVNLPTMDGAVLLMGGSTPYRNLGVTYNYLFDSNNETIQLTEHYMHYARWYPTATVLSNGDVVIQVSGPVVVLVSTRLCLPAAARANLESSIVSPPWYDYYY